MTEAKALFSILSNVVFNADDVIDSKDLSEDLIKKLYTLSNKYDLCPIVAHYLLKKEGLNQKLLEPFSAMLFGSLARHENRICEYEQVSSVFTDAKIPFMPVKGILIYDLYPEPYLRTSCDIDILVKEKDVKRMIEVIKKDLGFTFVQRSTHDVCFNTPSGGHFEFHFSLIEGCEHQPSENILKDVFDHAMATDGCLYEIDQDYLYYYLVAHTAKHFYNGGCGIRTLLDLELFRRSNRYDKDKCDALLEKGKLLTFERQLRELTDVWFFNKEHTDLTILIEQFILSAGTFGNVGNFVAIKRRKQSGVKYFFSRLFVPYDRLKRYYPSLSGRKYLLPFYQIRRWFAVIFSGRLGRSIAEVKISSSASDEKLKKLNDMFDKLEL